MLSLALITFPFRRSFFRFQTRHCRKMTNITMAASMSTAASGMKIFKAVVTVWSVIGDSSLNLEVVWKQKRSLVRHRLACFGKKLATYFRCLTHISLPVSMTFYSSFVQIILLRINLLKGHLLGKSYSFG